ncbi:Cu(I)-responsive transcriptional regulator [Chitinasiproducens palmae]|uniref:MerR family transcriptional regulator, copper efflux regulator n=1 Tax=Chitinasiproducens palmae TaxID=1770053 RepID=A0A1H2PJP6_9BURK|nr:Cu(I)-responsive transcriptional regulator [Chitinasiproducens palmae]SDV46094.1 MerR family transcriptional regulator, copper efflux regulator [Chitinasiproducens palmae]
MNIGEAAQASGVSVKMIRHYEAVGLIPPASRSEGNYRRYTEANVEELRFIGRARRLGFSVKQLGALLELWRDKSRPSREVKRLASEHLAELDMRISELTAIKQTLERLVASCHGDARPDCPILSAIASPRHG